MEVYLADKGLPLRKENNKKEHHDPLKWWKDHESKYPVVAALAEIFLCIPASSAPSERIWKNVAILKKYYYEEIAKGYKGALPTATSVRCWAGSVSMNCCWNGKHHKLMEWNRKKLYMNQSAKDSQQ
eukprot:scaffold15090_cov50-Cyclotella_meneghiniana.AAC.2